jgi:hypothetical protein
MALVPTTGVSEMTIENEQFWQTRQRGDNDSEYLIYLSCANDGKGGDITRNGAPLLSYDEWLAA